MQAPPVPGHAMAIDEAVDDFQATQIDQATQPLSQDGSPATPPDRELWGFLIPCNQTMARIDFFRKAPLVRLGRNGSKDVGNHVVLPGLKISNKHCEIKWDGNDSRKAIITVADYSSNGTFINGEKLGKGRHGVLKEGAEIAFGTAVPQVGEHSSEDYRYVFRLLAGGPPLLGLHAHYTIIHELGKGAFATVMKGLSKESGTFYAIKMIQSNKLRAALTHGSSMSHDGPQPTEQFAREISILERLQHPNICQLKEVFFEEANISLVLEWVPGGDLLDYILTHGALTEIKTQRITFQVCDAMAYIHAQGIAHRDLKPENILLSTQDKNEDPIVKVADFGLAKAVDSYTMLRTMCGTPAYLAPEVVCQEEKEGYQSVVDSWSVGVVVFSMLTNQSPFVDPVAASDVKMQIKHRIVEWAVLKQLNVSQEGESFIRELLQRRPEVRMTLADARNHVWLHTVNPTPSEPYVRAGTASAGSAPDRDLSMRSIRDEDSMDDDQVDASESSQNGPDSQPMGGRLVRRRQIIEEAAENGVSIPEPSQEMLRHAEKENAKYYTGTRHSRPKKRKADSESESPLTSTPEEEDDEEVVAAENMSVLPPTPINARAKRAKAQADSDIEMGNTKAPRTKRGGRGGGRGTARGKQARNSLPEVSEDEETKPRRSSRLSQSPQKPNSGR
ncbi:hypothetical protein QCA50_019523 [Cerrena zonata]|uniref:Pkinase-domain-containing protein n=1 Tax=Cerrena zonata TaxID=2478898 RepID=A0AAW0FJW6_9APHY